jgi:hypothetical protein
MNNIYIYINTITSFSIYSNLGNSCCSPSGATTPITQRPSTLSSASSWQTTREKQNAEAMPSLNTNLQRIHLTIRGDNNRVVDAQVHRCCILAYISDGILQQKHSSNASRTRSKVNSSSLVLWDQTSEVHVLALAIVVKLFDHAAFTEAW